MRKIVLLAIYLALAIFLSAIESAVLPTTVIPGTKLGLANLVTLVIIYQFGVKEAIAVAVIRVVTVSLVMGSIFSPTFVISVGGLVFSLCFLIVAIKLRVFSVVGESVLSSVGHVVGQCISVILLLELTSIIYILPYLVYMALVTGTVNGLVAKRIIKSVKAKMEVV